MIQIFGKNKMFEQEIETLHKIIKDNTIGNTHSIALKTILESNIPLNVKSFFKAEVEWLLLKERQMETRSSKFDYAQRDIQLLQEQIDLLLVYHYTFLEKDFFEACNRCIHFLFNYLCRPQWTLENFLFEEKTILTKHELAIKFKFCSDYGYYWVITEKFLDSKNLVEISKPEMTALIQKIDREIIRNNTVAELAKMSEPFFNFVYFIQDNATDLHTQGIPLKALVYFFEDKKIHSVAEFLLKQREQGKNFLQFEELVNLLSNNFVKKGFYVEEETARMPHKQLGISKQSQKEHSAHDLLIPEKDRMAIIKTMFANEELKFNSTVESILSSNSWEDAALALDHYFTMNDIKPYSREAILFTNALQSYFTNQQAKDNLQ